MQSHRQRVKQRHHQALARQQRPKLSPTHKIYRIKEMYVTPDNNQLQREIVSSSGDPTSRIDQHRHGINTVRQGPAGTVMHQSKFDPTYVQISKTDAAGILGITAEEFENRRLRDARCPRGFKDQENWMDPMRFRLSDIYAYSEVIMKTANPASMDPNVYRG